MLAFYSDTFPLRLPPQHRFPFDKYRKLRERVSLYAAAWGIELREAPAANVEQLRRVHDSNYIDKVLRGGLSDLEQRRIGFPWSPEMAERSLRSTGATIAAAQAALEHRVGVHLAGGTHHAFADAGQGFCVFNDVAVAARVLMMQAAIRQIVVIDCDVHQGNGTADIFRHDHDVFTFSMHGDRNFPFRKQASDLDISLPDGTGDAAYLSALRQALNDHLPLDTADCVFYLAGADPYQADRYGRLSLSKAGLAARDTLVLEHCLQRRLPVVVVMAGGYAPNIKDIVDIHASTVQIAAQLATPAHDPGHGRSD